MDCIWIGAQLMHGVLMRTPSSLDEAWKRRVAASVLSSLTDARCQRYVYFTVDSSSYFRHIRQPGFDHPCLARSLLNHFQTGEDYVL